MNKWYLLQVQESEGTLFRNLYYMSEQELNDVITEARDNKQIVRYSYEKNEKEIIPVYKMRVFIMRERISENPPRNRLS